MAIAATALVASACTLLNPAAVVLGGGVLQKGWPALRRCYPAAPLLPAPLKAELTVLPDGAVEKAVVDGPADARACAAAALRPLRFPRFAGSSFVRISYVLRAHGR